MKNYILIFILLLTTGVYSMAQTVNHDIQQSFQQAQTENKYVLMVFSGSDWCKPCMQLKQKILTQDDFVKYSSANFLLHEVDFPYKRKNRLPKAQQQHNDALAEQYNPEGIFPKVLLFNDEKELLGEIDYEEYMTTDQFINQLNAKIKTQ